jgi:hypothetical protein
MQRDLIDRDAKGRNRNEREHTYIRAKLRRLIKGFTLNQLKMSIIRWQGYVHSQRNRDKMMVEIISRARKNLIG